GPTGLTGNRKMVEGAFPGFYRVRGHHRIPVQAIDWKTAMIDGGKKLRDTNALHAGLRAEIQTRKGHRDAPFHAAAKCEGSEIADVHSVFVKPISTCAAQAALAENIVVQNDLRTRICPGPF